jgi:serine/threonine protein kinase
MNPAQGTVIGNRFRLVRELGRGAMGAVWLADHLTLGVPCAVKIIADQGLANPEMRARFHAEAQAVARVQSANVVRIFDHDVCDDVPYIAMEFLEGEDLRTRLQRLGRLGTHGTYRIVSQVARGLAKTHAAGIVHRDLKPENVFVADDDGVEVAKLLDFGIAKLASCPLLDANIQIGAIFGSPHYMSPEQASGVREIDRRSDLWSLGVIAYECLTGRRPFDGDKLADLLAEVMGGAIPVPSELDPELPVALDDWWARAAARDPDQRFQTAGEFADALAAALDIDAPGAASSKPTAPTVFALEHRRASARAGSTLVMARNEVTHAESRPPRSRPGGLVALATTVAIAIVAGGLLDASAGVQRVSRAREAPSLADAPSAP